MQLCQNFGISGGFEHPKPPLGTPLPRRPRSASNKCNIPPANAACSRTLTHQHGRSNRPIRLSLSTASVFVSRFLVRKASRVVRAARGSVCLVEYHTGRNKVILRHLTTRQQIGGAGGGLNNQPPTHRPF